MKKLFLLIPILGMVLVGCSKDTFVSDEAAGANGSSNNIEFPTGAARSYLAVSVVPTSGMSTRAETWLDGYEDGTASEGHVNSVRFFFFDADGDPAPVRENRSSGTYNSFIDWYPSSSDSTHVDHDKTVETELKATFGITSPLKKPKSILAVINPIANVLNLDDNKTIIIGEDNKEYKIIGPSLTTIQNNVDNYLQNLHNYNFVMSNSVYSNNDKSEVYVTDIEENSFAETPGAAAAAPIKIYVERVLARLDFGVNITDGVKNTESGVMYKVGEYIVSNLTKEDDGTVKEVVTNKPIYVSLLGWNVTSTADESRLVKSINGEWSNDNIGITPWSTPDYKRSFWAMNPKKLSYQYGDFNGENSSGTNVNPATKDIPVNSDGKIIYSTTYLQENANAFSEAKDAKEPDLPTKVIIAAKLCDEDGKELEIAEWGYHKYVGKKSLLIYFAENVLANLYSKDSETKYNKITPEDLDFKTADELNMKTDDNSFYVYVVLSETGSEKTWCLKSGESYNVFADDNKKKANDYIYDVIRNARVWHGGKTYYYFDVEHLGDITRDANTKKVTKKSVGSFGIVRNHIYRTTVKSIKGLGTPVYRPDQVIIPEDNEYDESIVTAEIKILQWRVVKSEYDLVWP